MNTLKNIVSVLLICVFTNQFAYCQSGGANLCDSSEPLCGSSVFSYPNTAGSGSAEVGPNYGCLGSTPNPAWFFLQIAQDGNLDLTIQQSTTLGGPPNLDVDFIIYGPFNDSGSACSGGLTAVNTVDCSYSPNNVEIVRIPNAIAGEYYVLLITNFSDAPGFINVTQTSGTGTTNCGILADEIGCSGDTITLDATNASAANYVWFEDDGSGTFVVIPGVSTATYDVVSTNFYKAEAYGISNNLIETYNFNVIFYETPVVPVNIADIKVCDDDGIVQFDLATKNSEILNGLDPVDFSVTYYGNMVDAIAGINPLPLLYSNSLPSEVIYARVENTTDQIDCFDVGSFNINVFLNPVANPTTDYVLCSDTNLATFDFSTKISEVLGVQSPAEFAVKFYYTQLDANLGLPGTDIIVPIQNTLNPQTIFVRIENILNTDCYATTTIDLIVNSYPVVTAVVDLLQCDDDTDGVTLFNLTEANTLVSTNPTNETFTYYLTLAEAQTGLIADQIINFTAYPNPIPLSSIVYARVEAVNGCFRTSQINLIVSTTQIPSAFNLDYNVCDDYLIDNDNANGIATFNFSDATAQILTLFPPGQNLTVTYYISMQDALVETNAIADISNHRNDASPNVQNIVVRVDSDNVNACLGLGEHITLTVDSLPLNNSISDYALCSDTNQASFDLTTKDTEVIGGQAQAILISYHETLNDAETNSSPLITPYLNQTNPQTIYVRAQFDDNGNGVGDVDECFSTDMSLELVVIPSPVLFQPDPISICNEQIVTVYDLTVRENQITGGDTSIALSYFESQIDLDNNNPIPTPTSYTNTLLDRDILVLATGANMCTATITLSLNTVLYVNLNLTPTPIEECEVDNDGFDNFDLTRREDEILNGLDPLDFTFVYYEDELDVIAGNANFIPDPTRFINTQAVTQTIYVRVTAILGECFRIIPITLIVNPVPEIAILDEYVICLSSNGDSIPPDLITFLSNPPIDTQLNPAEYTFQWYNDSQGLPANIIVGAITPVFTPTVAGDYTVIATNIVTGCTIAATTVVIGSYPPESIAIELLTNAFVTNDILLVSVVGNGEYEYSLDHGLWQGSNRFENVSGGEHTIFVRDIYNCNLISDMQIVIDFPRFFTPNGDGFHDNWNIVGIDNQPTAKIFIYDRYGKLIKQINPTGQGWDGTFNGDFLPSSDYWFTVEYKEPRDGIVKQFKSHFTLKH